MYVFLSKSTSCIINFFTDWISLFKSMYTKEKGRGGGEYV